MGISILWIMLFHAGFQAPDNIVLRSLWYFFISFGGGLGVPIFLILSGMGLMFSKLRNSHANKWGIYANKRFIRIIPAYIIVATTYYLIKGESIYGVGYNLVFLNFIREGQRDFWYIAAIILCYAIFPFIVTLCRKFKPAPVLGCMSILCWVIAAILELSACTIYRNIEILIHRVPCFLMGMFIGYLLYNNANVKYTILNISCLALGGGDFLSSISVLGRHEVDFYPDQYPCPLYNCCHNPIF